MTDGFDTIEWNAAPPYTTRGVGMFLTSGGAGTRFTPPRHPGPWATGR